MCGGFVAGLGREAMITADCNLDARRHLSPVYMPSYHNPGDGFGGWEAMGRTWLQGLGFDVLDEAPAKPAPWTIAVGSLCWPRPPGRWATLWTAVDACALANPMAQLCRFDECWVATPSQVARLRELGFIGPVAVVRPPLVWRPRVALGAGYLVWVGTGAPRALPTGAIVKWADCPATPRGSRPAVPPPSGTAFVTYITACGA